MNLNEPLEHPKFNASTPNLPTARSISFTRQSLPRRAKPGGSLKEDSSSEDREAGEDEDEGMVTAEEGEDEEEDELAGDDEEEDPEVEQSEEDVFVDNTKSKSKKAIAATAALIATLPPIEDDSDLTELSDEGDASAEGEGEEEDAAVEGDGSQVEDESRDLEATPKARRTARVGRGRRRRLVGGTRSKMTRSRSRKDLTKLTGPRRATVEPEIEELDEEEEEVADEEDGNEVVEEEEETGEEAEDAEADADETVSEEEVADMEVEPRVLRNGKVVGEFSEAEDEGEEDVGVDVDEIEEDEESGDAVEEVEEDAEEVGDEAAGEDETMEEETEEDDDDMVTDFDLAAATVKSLGRLRRDELVQMCETRELEAEGTKHQLVESLLQWVCSYLFPRP